MHAGDLLSVNGETRVIQTVVSDSELTISSSFEHAFDGVMFQYQRSIATLAPGAAHLGGGVAQVWSSSAVVGV